MRTEKQLMKTGLLNSVLLLLWHIGFAIKLFEKQDYTGAALCVVLFVFFCLDIKNFYKAIK